MKKTYIAPELELTKMNDTDIIATSMNSLHELGNQTPLGRESIWFDDEF